VLHRPVEITRLIGQLISRSSLKNGVLSNFTSVLAFGVDEILNAQFGEESGRALAGPARIINGVCHGAVPCPLLLVDFDLSEHGLRYRNSKFCENAAKVFDILLARSSVRVAQVRIENIFIAIIELDDAKHVVQRPIVTQGDSDIFSVQRLGSAVVL
jgi:hypothetical protein